MRKTAKLSIAILAASVLTSAAAYAATPGTYAGLGLGAGKQQTSNLDLSNRYGVTFGQNVSNTGLAGRIFAGHNFDNNFGIEAGITQYTNADTKFTANNLVSGGISGSAEYQMTTFDLVGKAYLPLSESGFNIYGLGGISLVHSKTTTQVTAKNSSINYATSAKQSKSQDNVRPVIGVGASYDIPQTQLTAGWEYKHTFGKGNVKNSINAIPSADLVTLDLSYNFG